jgi:hypothetical protein
MKIMHHEESGRATQVHTALTACMRSSFDSALLAQGIKQPLARAKNTIYFQAVK